MEDTAVLIEAHYLDLISKELGLNGDKRIDIKSLAIKMAKENNLWCKEIFFYTCPPFQSSKPTADESRRKAKYDKFKDRLQKMDIIVREGRLQKLKILRDGKQEEKFTEKGVDTLFTIDLLKLKEKYSIKTAILLTCDTDFVPVIKAAKEEGTRVILYYYTDNKNKTRFSLSYYLANVCDSRVLLTEQLLNEVKFSS